jgi:hypothetical protein
MSPGLLTKEYLVTDEHSGKYSVKPLILSRVSESGSCCTAESILRLSKLNLYLLELIGGQTTEMVISLL